MPNQLLGRYTFFLCSLVALIAFSPWLPFPQLSLPLVFMVGILALLSLLQIERVLWIACTTLAVITVLLLFVSVANGWTLFDTEHIAWLWPRYALGAVFYLLCAAGILRRLFAEKEVTGDTIIGGIAVYFLIGFFWTLVYHCVVLCDSQAFSWPVERLDTFRIAYFSFICLTTVGFGDITPVSTQAQVISLLVASSGQIYLAVFVARLIGLHTGGRK